MEPVLTLRELIIWLRKVGILADDGSILYNSSIYRKDKKFDGKPGKPVKLELDFEGDIVIYG